MDHQGELVEQARLEQRPHERHAAGHPDVLPQLHLERPDRVEVTHDGGGLPVDLAERGRHHHLRRVVDELGERVVFAGLIGPVGGELIERIVPQQQRVRLRHAGADRLSHLVAEVLQVPVLR